MSISSPQGIAVSPPLNGEPPTGRRISIQEWTAIFTLMLAFAGIAWAWYSGVHNDINLLRTEIIAERGEMALVTQRVATLESKAQGYDRLIEQRTAQMTDIAAKLARIEEFMEQLKSGRYR